MNPKKVITYGLVIAASFVTLVGLSSRRAYAGAVTQQNVPFSYTVSPACNGDTVSVNGNVSVEANLVTSPDGTQHLAANVELHGTGTGSPSGQNYVFSANASETVTVTTNDTGEETVVPVSYQLIAQGGGQNLYVTNFFHITVTPDGTVTAYITSTDVNCRG